ncbi:BRCA1-associated protein [Kwoniella mangroviensis CBS 10435]|uniref:BRCA1-associated protein n=1 Tax=Kwoniella mangroviensis CBS 10435 TaxID=1331196 RepID=A0A1B9J134_9TREE|nr:BRCA1-associated protein [Kwoniella mangroviensis CBS 10435]
MTLPIPSHLYSLIIAIHSPDPALPLEDDIGQDWRLGEIDVDWIDFTQEKSSDKVQPTPAPSSSQGRKKHNPSMPSRNTPSSSKKNPTTVDDLSLQPLLAHYPNPSTGPNILDSSFASGISELGRGVVHLFKHPPPASLIASIDSHPIGEGSNTSQQLHSDLIGEKAEGEDGSLIAILAVPAWMRPADFIEFIGGWSNCLEGVRMIREANTPNRSIVLLKFRDPLQASDFSVIFTGKAFSTLDPRETCHPIRIHHLILHKLDRPSSSSSTSTKSNTIAVPAFPPSVYSSRARELPNLLNGVGVDTKSTYELPSCPVCLERLDSTVTGLVTLPCAHTFDCDCLRKWGDSKCPVCRLSHLLLSSNHQNQNQTASSSSGREITRLTKCSMCDSTENNWICVVCGTVGCGRYEPSKGHARRHWEESGHVLAMELETQRVWDYKGDNYVHRLIQSRSDGKLVELPSASSLVTSSHISRPLPLGGTPSQPPSVNGTPHRPSHTQPSSARGSMSSNDAGPSSGDVEKMATIESITLEYSYLLSSQLESMRHHYESQQSTLHSRLEKLESISKENEGRLKELEDSKKAREKAENKALKAIELSRSLQQNLANEKSLSNGLSSKITNLQNQLEGLRGRLKEKEDECTGLEETVKDLMFTLEAGLKVKELGDEGGQGGDLVVVPGKGKKKNKR